LYPLGGDLRGSPERIEIFPVGFDQLIDVDLGQTRSLPNFFSISTNDWVD
jgi:hypothetical protein